MAGYERLQFLFMTTDPVHIGTGGYRLGRVDNSIVREPGTRIPKIPGTSLHGAARSYAAQLYGTPEAPGKVKIKSMSLIRILSATRLAISKRREATAAKKILSAIPVWSMSLMLTCCCFRCIRWPGRSG